MPPVAAAVLPHPPLLLPDLAGAAAAELDPLRAACRQALSAVMAAADVVIVVGDGPVWGVPEPSAPGSFHPYGADVEVTLPALVDLDLPTLPPPARLIHLPLSLAVAAHLLAGLDPPPARLFAATVPASLGPGAAATIGRALIVAAGGHGHPASTPRGARATTADAGLEDGPRAANARDMDPHRQPSRGDVGTPNADLHDRPSRGAAATWSADPHRRPSKGEVADRNPDLRRQPGGGAVDNRSTDLGRWATLPLRGPREQGPRVPRGRVGLVVMGDLSACRTERAPGALRPEAAWFDASVAEAIRAGRPELLLDLDPVQATDLLVAGRVPLQVLAGAFEERSSSRDEASRAQVSRGEALRAAGTPMHHPVAGEAGEGGAGVRGQVLYEGAPYGVGYLVGLLTVP
jgi:hypothetical protein